MDTSHAIAQNHSNRLVSLWLVRIGIPWAIITLTLATLSEPTPENLTLFTAILGSGFYTLILRGTRSFWLPPLAGRPLRNAMLLGIFNAAVIETLFLVSEHAFGAEGVAAHPNLLMDLLLTMPWYIALVISFVNVQHKHHFSNATVLLLGALYELGADGFVGQIIGIPFGDTQLLEPSFWVMLVILIFWQFILVYSSIVLPPTWVLEASPDHGISDRPAWRDMLRPLFWLLPFTIYLFLFLTALGVLAEI